MTTLYYDPQGTRITLKAYNELASKTPNPYILREFENDRIRLALVRVGAINNAHVVPPEHRKHFEVVIWNIVDGKYSLDPDGTKTRTLDEATKHFERFLAKWTECSYDAESGKLVEVGNIHTPPDPNVPVFEEATVAAEEFGTW